MAFDDFFLRGVRLEAEGSPDDYWNALPAVRYLKRQGGLAFSCPVPFFVGENGTGKATLLEGGAAGIN